MGNRARERFAFMFRTFIHPSYMVGAICCYAFREKFDTTHISSPTNNYLVSIFFSQFTSYYACYKGEVV
eukprot:snap_masked-scaffold_8-processed-gene-6.38-mRNA-1 protein AED:1.00 eAED:1.00 QI:0/0/0/0/1/1/2/0/68